LEALSGDFDHKLIDDGGITLLLELAVLFAETMFHRIPTLLSSRDDDSIDSLLSISLKFFLDEKGLGVHAVKWLIDNWKLIIPSTFDVCRLIGDMSYIKDDKNATDGVLFSHLLVNFPDRLYEA
jgi:hypothetical protein